MKKISIILALAFAFTTGMTAIRGLRARTTTLPVYVVVEIDEITDANMALRLSAKRPRLPTWKSNLRTVAISRVQKM